MSRQDWMCAIGVLVVIALGFYLIAAGIQSYAIKAGH
jgi:hypothetical protein